MRIASLDQLPGRSNTYVRVYNCPACHHEAAYCLGYRHSGSKAAPVGDHTSSLSTVLSGNDHILGLQLDPGRRGSGPG